MKINGKGAPTSKTVGAIGDIYVDTRNGNRYRCTMAYKSCGEIECEWEPDKDIIPLTAFQNAMSDKVVAVKFEDDVVKTVDKPVDKPIEKPEKPQYNNQPQRQYTKYRKENNHGKNQRG